jgi:CBS domain-containing protein
METKVMRRTVAEAMTVRPIAVRPETPLGELFALFEQHDINGIPITDARGVLVGLVTKLDLLRMFHSPVESDTTMRHRRGERVVDFMTRGLVTVEPTDSVATAIDLMVDFRLRMLPVIERRNFERHLVGVVSRKDLLRWVEVE